MNSLRNLDREGGLGPVRLPIPPSGLMSFGPSYPPFQRLAIVDASSRHRGS